MLMCLPHIRNSSRQRAMYIVCMCFVFSYIAFNVLDLDGSNLTALERSSMLAVMPSDVEIPYSPARVERAPRNNNLLSTNDESSPRQAHLSVLTPASLARAHGYKVSLARNSLSDSSPYG